MFKENIRRALGDEFENLQDVIFIRSATNSQNSHKVIVFANLPIGNKPADWHDLSFLEIASYAKEENKIDEIIQWKIKGKKSSVRIKFDSTDLVFLRPALENSPRYADLLTDGKLGGMIMIAHNLHLYAGQIAQNYQEYFTSRGFTVAQQSKVNNQQAFRFILDRVKSGEIDYAIREGHREFSPEIMLSLSKNVEIVRLIRRASHAHDELVYLVISQYDQLHLTNNAAAQLAVSDLGAALRARPSSENQFIYFDSACSGHSNIPALFEYAAAPGFMPISSKNMLSAFHEGKGTAGFEFIDGIRSLRSYEQLTSRIDSTEALIFPNQGENYLPSLADDLLKPLSVSIERHFPKL